MPTKPWAQQEESDHHHQKQQRNSRNKSGYQRKKRETRIITEKKRPIPKKRGGGKQKKRHIARRRKKGATSKRKHQQGNIAKQSSGELALNKTMRINKASYKNSGRLDIANAFLAKERTKISQKHTKIWKKMQTDDENIATH